MTEASESVNPLFDQHTAKRLITQEKQQSKHYYASIIRHKLCRETHKKNVIYCITAVVSGVLYS